MNCVLLNVNQSNTQLHPIAHIYPNKYYLEQVLTKYALYFRNDIVVNPHSFAKVNVYYENLKYAVTIDSISVTRFTIKFWKHIRLILGNQLFKLY